MQFSKVSAPPPVKHDQYGRYVLPDPITGEETSWTRVTTIINTIKDMWAIQNKNERSIVYGIGQRPDLNTHAASCTMDDYGSLSKIASDAKAAAASSAAANVGTAMHKFLERIDMGEDVRVPDEFRNDVDAYLNMLKQLKIEIRPKWIERIVCIPKFEACGTIDRMVDIPNAFPRVGDIKTATDKEYNGSTTNSVLKYSQMEIACQLALYANAEYVWTGKKWRPMPEIDRDVGHVFHVPAKQGVARMYDVDLQDGLQIAYLAHEVYQLRKRKDLIEWDEQEFSPTTSLSVGDVPAAGGVEAQDSLPMDSSAPSPVETLTSDDSSDLKWLEDRVEVIKLNPEARKMLATLWKHSAEDVPTFKNGGPTTATGFNVIVGLCNKVEKEFSIPFGPSQPKGEDNG